MPHKSKFTQTDNQRFPLRIRVNKRGPSFRFTIYKTDPLRQFGVVAAGYAKTRHKALKQGTAYMRILRAGAEA